MKNLAVFSVALFIVAVIFSSCRNSGSANELSVENVNIEGVALYQTLLLSQGDNQRNIFSGLSPKEKSAVWKAKYDHYLSFSTWTPEQKQFISDLKSIVSPAIFIENSQEEKNLHAIEKEFRANGLKIFSQEQLRKIMATLENYEFNPNINNQRIATSVECECSGSSDWCYGSSTCSAPCSIQSRRGCGTMFIYACNGDCN